MSGPQPCLTTLSCCLVPTVGPGPHPRGLPPLHGDLQQPVPEASQVRVVLPAPQEEEEEISVAQQAPLCLLGQDGPGNLGHTLLQAEAGPSASSCPVIHQVQATSSSAGMTRRTRRIPPAITSPPMDASVRCLKSWEAPGQGNLRVVIVSLMNQQRCCGCRTWPSACAGRAGTCGVTLPRTWAPTCCTVGPNGRLIPNHHSVRALA